MHDNPEQMSPRLARVMNQIANILRENDFAGGVIAISAKEAAVHVGFETKWNGVHQQGDVLALEFQKGDAIRVAATKHMAQVVRDVSEYWMHGAEVMLEIINRHTTKNDPSAVPDENLPHADAAKEMLSNLFHLNRKDKPS